MTGKAQASLAAFALVLSSPLAAAACPLCIAAQDESVQIAYLIATAFMSLLPLGLVGGLVYWLRGRARQLESEAASGEIAMAAAPEHGRTIA